MNILVVCIGNICRSPYAEALLARALPQAQVSSAGLEPLTGHPADPVVQQLAAEQGIDLSHHVAQPLLEPKVRASELIFVMSTSQVNALTMRYPFARGRTFRLGHWLEQDIPDPYRHPESVHRSVQDLIQASVASWLLRLQSF